LTLKRTPMKPGTKGLQRKTPMARGTSVLQQKKPLARGQAQLARQATPIRSRSKTNANPRPATGEAALCRGRSCYLAIPGLCRNDVATVVPAHSNQAQHGKGRGIKAHDVYTVPACFLCHAELDQGNRFTRLEKFALWDQAFERWRHDRAVLMGMNKIF